MLKKNINKNGFTIIEALVTLFIFSLITLTFYSIFTAGTNFIIESKNRNSATALANEKMEIIRSLAYADVGTIGGVPQGSINPDEYLDVNGRKFHVQTSILYTDDSFDGTGASDDNDVMTDYKTVKIKVLWGQESESNQVELVSRFVPPGIETGDPNAGTLLVSISSQDGFVSGAKVKVENDVLSSNLNMTTETDDYGQVSIPGLQPTDPSQTYKITVSKSGYETVETSIYGEVPYIPFDKHGSVVAKGTNQVAININKLANLKIYSVEGSSEPIPEVGFSMVGGRALDEAKTIFNFNTQSDEKTDENGKSEFTNISPGIYTLTPKADVSGYKFIGTVPAFPYELNPGESLDVKINYAKSDEVWVLVIVKDSSENLLEGAEVKLTNSILGYDKTVVTLKDGIAFFSEANNLQAGEYDLSVAAPGYINQTSKINVTNENVEEVIKLSTE